MNIPQTVKDAVAIPVAKTALLIPQKPEEKIEEQEATMPIEYKGFTDTEDEKPIEISTMDFDVALSRYINSSRESRQMARLCAEMAIVEFANSGQLAKCQLLLDSISPNYGRLLAYKAWLIAFCPVRFNTETKRLKKDKSPEAKPFDIEGALAKPFWEFKPESDPVEFDISDLMKAVSAVLRKHRGDKMIPKNDAVKARLTKLEVAVDAVS